MCSVRLASSANFFKTSSHGAYLKLNESCGSAFALLPPAAGFDPSTEKSATTVFVSELALPLVGNLEDRGGTAAGAATGATGASFSAFAVGSDFSVLSVLSTASAFFSASAGFVAGASASLAASGFCSADAFDDESVAFGGALSSAYAVAPSP